MTIHKYFTIIHEYYFTPNVIFAMIVAAWTIPFGISMGTTYIGGDGTLISIQANGHWCLIAMNKNDNVNLAATCMIFVVIIGAIFILGLAHAHLIYSYKTWNKAKRGIGEKREKEQEILEWKLLKKSVAIAGCFSLSFIFFLIKGFYEVINELQVASIVDDLTGITAISSPMINIVMLYTSINSPLQLVSFNFLVEAFRRSGDPSLYQ